MASDETRIESLFFAALNHPTTEAREAFLREACAADDALRRRVARLLDAHPKAHDFLADPAVEPPEVTSAEIAERPGSVIDHYKLLQVIGEGGFGVVFMAEQMEPVQRRVALKIIKPGMDTRQVVARFEAERQALALMDHPNIAKVFDAGATDSGRPYFVMELVRGVPITDYCDAHGVPLRDRLELFADVCRAVQHAHQKGVIHRDLKPNNVLVTLHDGKPVVKVIDFGIAKATGGRLTDKTVFTGFAQLVGTPLYMSPEQAEWSGLDVDTRSDIYSLGVLLYELLTGTTPFDRERLGKAALDEVRRIIREEEPPKPSTRISTLGQRLSAIAAHRKAEPARLGRLVRGDLDWIVMRALEKDRNRRYETAISFARDVERYLIDEPVEARAPSAGYRFGKFARRHKAPLTAAAAIIVALIAGATVATWQAVRATRAESLAQSRYIAEHEARQEADDSRVAAEAARQEATQEASKARAAADLLLQMLASNVPAGVAADETARHTLDDLVAHARALPFDEENIWLWYRLYMTRLAVGDVEGGRGVALEMLEVFGQTKDPAVARQVLYASVPVPGAITDSPATERLCDLALKSDLGFDNRRLVGAVRYRQGRYTEAIDLLEEADEQRAWDLMFLAMAHQRRGELEEAREHLAAGVRWIETSPPDYWVGWWEEHEVATLRTEAERLILGTGEASSEKNKESH